MAEQQMDATLLVALQVLPALSIFITGFASVRAHARRDRAFARSDQIENEIRRVTEDDKFDADRATTELAKEHTRSLGRRPSMRDAVVVNVFVVVAVVALQMLAGSQLGWRFTLAVSEVSLAFLGFCAILSTAIILLVLTLFDAKRIEKELKERRVATLWGKVATVSNLLESDRLDQARATAAEVLSDKPGAAWAARLRARVELGLGKRGDKKALGYSILLLSRR
jgi:hypothetical protein